MMNVFCGKFIPGALKIATNKLLSDYSIYPPHYREHASTVIRNLALMDKNDQSGKIWYEVDFLDEQTFYINIVPGEFSNSKPEGSEVIIKKLNISNLEQNKSNRLNEFINSFDNNSRVSSENEKLISQLSEVVNNGKAIEKDCENYFYSLSNEIRQAQNRATVEELFHNLYTNCYYNYKMSLTAFSSCIVLVQMQLEARQWIDQNPYSNPENMIYNFAKLIINRNKSFLNNLSDIGNYFYEEASNNLTIALKSLGYESYQNKLRISAHFYWCSLMVGKVVEDFTKENILDYNTLIAEEGWACCVTGISFKEFLFSEPDYFPKFVSKQIRKETNYELKFNLNYSSPTKPIFPNYLSKIFVGSGKTLEKGEEHSKGLKMLKDIEESFNTSIETDTFDWYLLEHSLSVAYSTVDNIQMKDYYAKRFTQRILSYTLLNGI